MSEWHDVIRSHHELIFAQDLVLTEILSKVSFVVYASHQRRVKRGEDNLVHVPTAILVGDQEN